MIDELLAGILVYNKHSSLSWGREYTGYTGLSGVGQGYGIRIIEQAVIRSRKCLYCGNIYASEFAKTLPNCPTCAGGWSD